MIRWLKRLFGFGQPWSNAERSIYRYWNGKEWIWADPLEIQRKLTEVGGDDWQEWFTPIRMAWSLPSSTGAAMRKLAAKESAFAVRKLVEMTRKVFDLIYLHPKTGVGLIDSEVLEILYDYMAFIAELVSEVGPLADSLPSTEPAASSSPIASSPASPSPSMTWNAGEPSTWPTDSLTESPASSPEGNEGYVYFTQDDTGKAD